MDLAGGTKTFKLKPGKALVVAAGVFARFRFAGPSAQLILRFPPPETREGAPRLAL